MSKKLPIEIPQAPRTGDRHFNEYMGRVVRTLQRFRDRFEEVSRDAYRRIWGNPNNLELLGAVYNSTSGGTTCYVQPGSLEEIAFGAPSQTWHPFTYDSNTHFSNTAILLGNGQSLYAYYYVESNGAVDASSPALIVGNANTNGAHWIPESPEAAGTAGEVYLELFNVPIVGGLPEPERVHDGNPTHYQDGWFGNNVGNGSQVYKNVAVDGTRLKHTFRSIKGVGNVTVTQTANEIEISSNSAAVESSHPWKVTGNTDGTCDIAAGFVFGYYFEYDPGMAAVPASTGNYAPDDIVLGPGSEYAGGNHAITGTQYLYVEGNRASESDDEYSEAYEEATLTDETLNNAVELYDGTAPGVALSIVKSSDAPSAYTPTSGKFAVCIAKVTNTAGTVAVDKQYLTHNPTVFVPLPRLHFYTS